MIANLDDKTILIHFDASSVQTALVVGAGGSAASPLGHPVPIEWYCQWASQQMRSVYVLLPERLKDRFEQIAPRLGHLPPIWYADDGPPSLPQVHGLDHLEGRNSKGQVWLVNGDELPLVDWDEATLAAGRSSADVVVFGPPDWAVGAQYPESLQVDEGGEVTRFLRHYSDSPIFADAWKGSATLLVTGNEHGLTALTHLLRFGWGLDSIGSLTRRFSVRWSVNGCVASRLDLQSEDLSSPAQAASHGAMPTSRERSLKSDLNSVLSETPSATAVALPTAPSTGDDSVDLESRSAQLTTAAQTTHATPQEHEIAIADAAELSDRTEARPSAAAAPQVAASETGAEPHSLDGDAASDQALVETLNNAALYSITKRALDTLLAVVLLVAFAPVFVILAILIKRDATGPIFFGHKRQGLNGREFRCWKFRTMVDGADGMQDDLRADNEVDGPQFKITCDPRLTGVGGILRRYNLDELPQLLNVLLGQMSFVGPRPSPDRENQLCPGWRRTRLSMRPGITGLWQILRLRHESESDFQEWIYYDVEYARHRSLWLDLQIIFHTPLTLFSSKHLHRFAHALQRRGICVHSGRVS